MIMDSLVNFTFVYSYNNDNSLILVKVTFKLEFHVIVLESAMDFIKHF